MEVLKSINIKSPVILLKSLWNDKLAVVDKQTAVRILHAKNFSTIAGFKSNIAQDHFTPYTSDISMDGKYSLAKLPGTSMVAFFSVEDKKMLYKLGRKGAEAESVSIDPLNRYCVIGGQDGKVTFWVLKTARLALSLPAHNDYVTAMAFSETGQWFASGSYDRSIMLLNLSIMRQPLFLKGGHSSVVVGIAFLSNSNLLSFDKEGNGIIWNILNGKIHKRLPKMHDQVSVLALSPEGCFAFVGTKLGYVGLYDLETMELIKNRYIKESDEITALTLIPDGFRLVVGTNDGTISIYSLFGDEARYKDMINKGEVKPFYDDLSTNPILSFSKTYEEAERLWIQTLIDSKMHLQRNELDKAKKLLAIFSGVPSKKAIIANLSNQYDKYEQFQINVQEGKYSLAYSMAKQYPIFAETDPYIQMEQKWKKLFLKAQEIVQKPGGEEEAKALLSPYRGISEKTLLIQQMITEKKLYDFFKKLIAQRDFLKIFELVKSNPFLKEFAEYSALMEYADKLYIQTQIGFMAQEFNNAIRGAEILIHFPDYSIEAQEMIQTIKIRENFLDAVASDNLAKAFEYMSMYPMLYELPDGMRLENGWNTAAQEAQKIAIEGEIDPVYALLEPYHAVHAKYVNLAVIYAQVYQVQLEKGLLAEKDKKIIEQGIKRYLNLFGADESIKTITENYNHHYRTSIDLEMLKQGSIESWTPSMIIPDICKED